jgi:hypothetical protein
LKIALLCFVDDECIPNYLSNSTSWQDNNIAKFFTNVVLKYWKATMFVAFGWINWYFFTKHLQMQFNLSYSCSWQSAQLTRIGQIVHYTSYTQGYYSSETEQHKVSLYADTISSYFSYIICWYIYRIGRTAQLLSTRPIIPSR